MHVPTLLSQARGSQISLTKLGQQTCQQQTCQQNVIKRNYEDQPYAVRTLCPISELALC